MVVMAPKDENELRHMIKTALEWNGPIAVRYPRGSGYGVPLDQRLEALPIGRAEVLREGEDVALIALGSMVRPSLAAAELLAAEGVQACVVNARFAKPLDGELIAGLARRIGRIVTVEEHALMGGFGSAVLEALEEAGLYHVAVKRLGIPDRFIEHAKPESQLAQCGLTPEHIARSVLSFLGAREQAGAYERS